MTKRSMAKRLNIALIAFVFIASMSYAQVSKVVGGHNPWPPYIEADGSGLVRDILVAAFDSQGMELEIQIAPFSRMIVLLDKHEVDFIAALWWTEKRHETILFSQPYFHNELAVVSKKNKLMDFRGAKSLRYKTVAAIRGYAYHELFESIEQLKVIDVHSLHACLELVHKGRVDFAVADILAFQHELTKDPELNDLIAHTPTLLSWPLHIGVSREHPDGKEIINRFNQGLMQIKREGLYQNIVAKYFGEHAPQ
ncbi:amino acid ABC transporter substrate-binding protein [Pseudoalteromonas sp. JBTF-M23]|uniref:Amino acid ABC transporter substrate-binding protein n=1 Tax=Pseudoalteromonas caenipelagi TaxID=2726988 RepID=A0A849VHZ0_9GAMM|nr:transporter substrate-binding domain-containing protein [Pseudoalteromonas caenipelagi]NOU52896.1 amino acid ABC transporter substrate-binding protein [Pseudoalteromonas caenipelagi]